MVLLILTGRQAVDAVGKRPLTTRSDQTRRHRLRHHQPHGRPVKLRQQRGQPRGQRARRQSVNSTLRNAREFGQRQLQVVGRKTDRFSMKEPRRKRLVPIRFIYQNHRVVGHRVEFYADLADRIDQRVPYRAEHLRRAPQRIRVLDSLGVSVGQRRSFQKRP